jgi:hypothetical protein
MMLFLVSKKRANAAATMTASTAIAATISMLKPPCRWFIIMLKKQKGMAPEYSERALPFPIRTTEIHDCGCYLCLSNIVFTVKAYLPLFASRTEIRFSWPKNSLRSTFCSSVFLMLATSSANAPIISVWVARVSLIS